MAETDKNVIGIAMELDVTDLKSGLVEVNKEIKKSKEDFAVATSSMDNWQKSADGVTAKLTQLNTQLNMQAKAIAGYKAEIERVSKLEGDHTATLDRLRAKLAQAETSFKVTQGQVKRYEASLQQLNKANISRSITAAQTALSKFGNELKKVTKAQLAQNVAMLANPYAIAAAGVGFLIGKITELIQRKREESNAENILNQQRKESEARLERLKDLAEKYTSAVKGFSDIIKTSARSYTEMIERNAALEDALKKLEEDFTKTGQSSDTLSKFLDNAARRLQFMTEKGLESTDSFKRMQENFNRLAEPVVLLTARMVDLGLSEEETAQFLARFGFSTQIISMVMAEATKRVDEFNASINQAEQEKDIKPVEFYSTTQLAGDKKHYEEWARLREAREYKLATLSADLTEKERVAETKAIDDEMAKHDKYVKRYLEAQIKMKLAAGDTADYISQTSDKLENGLSLKLGNGLSLKLKKILDEIIKWANVVSGIVGHIGDAINAVIEAVSTYWDNYYAERKKQLEDEAAAETEQREHDLSEIERQYMNYEITLDEFKAKKAAIEADITNNEGSEEEERQKKKEELEREEDQRKREIFEAQKATNIAMLWIQSSIGQVTSFVNAIRDLGFPAGPIVGGITAGAILTQTIAETVAMASQQYVSAFAKGGIVDRPTLGLVGEAGREAIMPLENNTEWINELARKIAVIQRTDLSAGISGGNNYSYGGDTINNNRSNYNYTQNIYAPKTPSRLDLYRDGKRLLTIGRGG